MGYSYLKQGLGSHFEKVEVIGYAPADHPGVQVSSAIPSATPEGLCAVVLSQPIGCCTGRPDTTRGPAAPYGRQKSFHCSPLKALSHLLALNMVNMLLCGENSALYQRNWRKTVKVEQAWGSLASSCLKLSCIQSLILFKSSVQECTNFIGFSYFALCQSIHSSVTTSGIVKC